MAATSSGGSTSESNVSVGGTVSAGGARGGAAGVGALAPYAIVYREALPGSGGAARGSEGFDNVTFGRGATRGAVGVPWMTAAISPDILGS